MNRQAPEIKHLAKTDPVMKRLIREVGPFTLTPRSKRSPFESLARAIAYQQLHDKAAESIVRRFVALFPTKRFPQPADVLAMNERFVAPVFHGLRLRRSAIWPLRYSMAPCRQWPSLGSSMMRQSSSGSLRFVGLAAGR